MSELLQWAGIEVHPCANGSEAIALCDVRQPDVALLDLNMPGLDGFDTARQLRRNTAHDRMRIVALTGRGTWDVREKAIDAGFDEFLTKPVTLDVLLRALNQND